MSNPFRYFNSSSEVIRLVVMMYVRYPLSLRNVEDLLAERGIDISHEKKLSPSSRPSCARPRSEPSTAYGPPSLVVSTSSAPTNAKTISPPQDTMQAL